MCSLRSLQTTTLTMMSIHPPGVGSLNRFLMRRILTSVSVQKRLSDFGKDGRELLHLQPAIVADPIWRPMPDCLRPPNETSGVTFMCEFTQTVPELGTGSAAD